MNVAPERELNEAWRRIIEKRHIAHVKGAPAVNKPLLLLQILARAKSRGENRFCYPEIEDQMREALIRFGPDQKTVSPSLAYWNLQSDGVWVIEGLNALPLGRDDKRPTVRTLRENKVCARVVNHLWRQLLENQGLIRDLAQAVAHKYLPASVHAEVLAFFWLNR